MRLATSIAIAIALSGCMKSGPMRIELPGLTSHGRPADPDISRAWPYAQIAYNSYHRDEADARMSPFKLPDRFHAIAEDRRRNDDIGLAYDVLTEDVGDTRFNLIFAFRGTEGPVDLLGVSVCDWKFGNLRKFQQERAVGYVQQYLADLNRTSRNGRKLESVILTGHSLGGAIATHVSFRIPGSYVYAFNSSPRFRRPRPYVFTSTDNEPRRYSITQHLEILKITRMFSREASQNYLSLRCTRGLPKKRHSMFALAKCLTTRAAKFGDTDAVKKDATWSLNEQKPQFEPRRQTIDDEPSNIRRCRDGASLQDFETLPANPI
jgi:hypothetical protein